jgi:uncharacterized protein
MESYVETYTGDKFYFLTPETQIFNLEDIAHSLSMNCRFTGHCSEFYSVAEHSWQVARMLEGCSLEIQLGGLLHDASEAYITDIASPIKQHLPDYRNMEDNILKAIFTQYDLEYPQHPAIKQADLAMLSVEAHHLLPSGGRTWDMWKTIKRPPPNNIYKPVCMSPKQAKQLFIDKFMELHVERRANRKATAG